MIRYPNIIGKTDAQKLEQVKSYLHQLADELNFQLNNPSSNLTTTSAPSGSTAPSGTKNSIAQFNDIKALIIKSADIVDAYYEEINKKLEGQYVAESDFGTYKEETQAQLTASSAQISSVLAKQELIETEMDEVERNLRSEIEQTADSIKLEVTGGEPGKTAAIKLTVGDKSYSGEIDMTGLVTFSNLKDGTTEISGDNIKTGKILAEYIDVTNLIVSRLYALDGNGSGITLDVLGLKRTSADKLNPLIELHHDWIQTGGFLEEKPYLDLFKTSFNRDVNPGALTGGITGGVHLDADCIEFRANIENFSDYPVHSYDHTVDFGISRFGDVTGKLKVDTPTEDSHVVNKQYVDDGLAKTRPNTWNPSFLTDAGNSNYRGGLQYSGSPTKPLYMAVWDADDSATGTQPNRRVRSIEAADARALMGAAPAGYGLGTTGKRVSTSDDLNDVYLCGFYSWDYAPVNAPFSNGVMLVLSYSSNRLVQVIWNTPGNHTPKYRIQYNGTWSSWKDVSTSDFAPAGYGYGGAAVPLSSSILSTEDALTTALAAAYDSMGNQETKLVTYAGYPSPSDWRWFGILTRSSANNGSFVAQGAYNGGSQFMKTKNSGAWKPCVIWNAGMCIEFDTGAINVASGSTWTYNGNASKFYNVTVQIGSTAYRHTFVVDWAAVNSDSDKRIGYYSDANGSKLNLVVSISGTSISFKPSGCNIVHIRGYY